MTAAPGRSIDVAPERLARWLAGFEGRHGGPLDFHVGADRLVAVAADGARADCELPFPPLRADAADPAASLIEHATADRRVGVLLVRLGGYAVGIFGGAELHASKVGARPVHGRNAAGGQSQQRFARRRAGQVRVALSEAADVAARILGPESADLDAVVTGGDRRAITTVLTDRRLAALGPLVQPRLLDVPNPRLRVLLATPAQFRAVRISLSEPPPRP